MKAHKIRNLKYAVIRFAQAPYSQVIPPFHLKGLIARLAAMYTVRFSFHSRCTWSSTKQSTPADVQGTHLLSSTFGTSIGRPRQI